MSHYNAQPDSAADYAGWEAFDPELAPFLPTTDQSGGCDPPACTGAGQPVTSQATLNPNVGSVPLHAKAGSTGRGRQGNEANKGPHDPPYRREPANRNDDFLRGGSVRHSRVACEPPHTCTACSASFSRNYQLEQHATKNKHKAYLCTCGKAFTKLSALRRHFEESTKAPEHQCPLCDNEFKRPGHVEQHLRLVHKKPNDVIKDLLSAQKWQPRRDSGPAGTASTAAPTTGYVDVQADDAIANPGEPWTGPIDFSAPAPADYPGSRPVDFSAFSHFSALGPGHMTGAPAFAPQSFMTQTSNLPPYSAYPAGAGAAQTGFPANLAPDFVGYPAAHSDGNLDLSNVDLGSLFLNLADGLEMPALGNDFTWEPFGSDFNTFDF